MVTQPCIRQTPFVVNKLFRINHSTESSCGLVTFKNTYSAQSEEPNVCSMAYPRAMKFLWGHKESKISQGSHGGETAIC